MKIEIAFTSPSDVDGMYLNRWDVREVLRQCIGTDICGFTGTEGDGVSWLQLHSLSFDEVEETIAVLELELPATTMNHRAKIVAMLRKELKRARNAKGKHKKKHID